jgi:putative hydrolase of the HAD superfamily
MRGLSTIAFDADDTLWHSERAFRLSEQWFAALLADHVDSGNLSQRLLETEKRNLAFYGFGRKGFILSMIETAIDVTDGRVPTAILKDLIDRGRDMAEHPIEVLPDVRETLEVVAERYRILLITKRDLLDQEQKLARSGLGDQLGHFHSHPLTWALEHTDAPKDAPRFRQIERIGELSGLLAEIDR